MNTQKNKKKIAFSLIELSVVVLIIGILVLGITKGSTIIKAAKLSSAQSLTKNSPANTYGDQLAFWLEPTADNSFNKVEVSDGGAITKWNDIKVSSMDPVNFLQFPSVGVDASDPKYIANNINGLPSLRLEGTAPLPISALSLPDKNASIFSQGLNQISVFVVFRIRNNQGATGLFLSQNGQINIVSTSGVLQFSFGESGGYLELTPPNQFYNKPNILAFVRRPNGDTLMKINGVDYTPEPRTIAGDIVSTSNFNATFYSYFPGSSDIGEVMVFRTGLKNFEVSEVETYLSKKWSIDLKGW